MPRVTARFEQDAVGHWGFTGPSISLVIEFDHNDTDEAIRIANVAHISLLAQIERSRPAKENT